MDIGINKRQAKILKKAANCTDPCKYNMKNPKKKACNKCRLIYYLDKTLVKVEDYEEIEPDDCTVECYRKQGSDYRLDEDCTELFESILDCKNKIEELDSEFKEENSQDKNQLMTKVKNLAIEVLALKDKSEQKFKETRSKHQEECEKLKERIIEIEEENYKKDETIKSLEEENKQLKEKVDNQNDAEFELNPDVFKMLMASLGQSNKTNDRFDFDINLLNPVHKSILIDIKNYKFYPIHRVNIENLQNNLPEVNELFTYSLINEIYCCRLEGPEKIYSNYYIDGLEKMLRHITKEVYIKNFINIKDSFERIVKASSNAERLLIHNSNIQLDADFDFSGPKYRTEYISFNCCGNGVSDNWSGKKTRFFKILKGFSECGLKHSLKKINIYNTGVAIAEAKNCLEAYDMPDVDVVTESDVPITI